MSELLDVLVVGAGPTGLTASCELARRGVSFRVIDKLEKATDKSKALVLHARTLELLKILGCVESFLADGLQIVAVNAYDGKKRIARLTLSQIDSPYHFALSLPQHETEKKLYEHLLSLGKKVERACELVALREETDHVVAQVSTSNGKEETIRCKYLIACDGAHSTVRHIINEPYEGGDYEELFQLADVKVDWAERDPPAEIHAFSAKKGNAAFFPMPNNRWRVIAVIPPAEAGEILQDREPTLAEVQARIDSVCPQKLQLSEPIWLANFKIRYRKVKNYRRGRIFLAGDAAHCHSPVGGQGMNTGMQDAFNLAWKLALACKGQANEKLLDSYQVERSAIAEQLLRSVDLMTRINLLRAPVARELRNKLAPLLVSQDFVKSRLRNFLSEIGINYRRSPIVGELRRNPVQTALSMHVEDEPRLGDWFEFSHGPHAGDRVPEAHMIDLSSGQPARFSDLLQTCKHNLVFITGDQPGAHTYKHFCSIAADALGKYGDFLELSLITCEEALPAGLDFSGRKFADLDYSVHERFGAGAPCMYIIRPDAYIGFRSQPPEFEEIEDYFEKILSI